MPQHSYEEDKAFQKRLSHRLQTAEFIAWLGRGGYNQNEVTAEMVDTPARLIEEFRRAVRKVSD
jgi:hypothetical protein